MKKSFQMPLFFMLLILFCPTKAKNAVTFEFTGRLGDNIMTYCQHVWLAFKYNLDLYVPHFRYKEFFTLSDMEKSTHELPRFTRALDLRNETQLSDSANNILYNSSYYMRLLAIKNNDELGDFLFRQSIEDPTYGMYLQRALSLKSVESGLQLPMNRVSVAVHVRKGCDFDYPIYSRQYEADSHSLPFDKTYSDRHHCVKFPPEQFYAEQLEKLFHYLHEKPLYVFVFTDSDTPEEMVAKMRRFLNNRCDIIFETRKSNFSDSHAILKDIYDMSKFEYLIRSESHFPWIAQMIGNHKGIIRPVAWTWEGAYLKMTRTLLDIPYREMHQLITQDF